MGTPASAICWPAACAPLPGVIVNGIASPSVVIGCCAQYTKVPPTPMAAMTELTTSFLKKAIVPILVMRALMANVRLL